MAEEFVPVARDQEVVENTLTRVEIDGEPVVLTRVGGEIRAVCGICTHEDAELADGDIEDGILWCPLHASGFDVATGGVTSPPAEEPLAVYDVRMADGTVLVSRHPRPTAPP